MSETLAWVAALSLLPLLLMVTTSFAKLAVVLAMLRNALGVGGVPEGAVIAALAGLLSVYVMLPVGRELAVTAAPFAARIDTRAPFAGESGRALSDLVERGVEPLRAFLDRNSGGAERGLFLELARRGLQGEARERIAERDLFVVLPAFFVTELKEAFQIGFLLLLPFLVLDLVVATILSSLGMSALTPSTVALPFKLLLFVSVDGFRTLLDALVRGYQ
ncbi:MAG TPA: EscR/YscR/HrcR family type III secretion system export apparatus protein [Polyangiales bacterium]|nr:EscR/YscR/HrcR family type III secretion system export apparatus protein [Polyangiales bacterium]